jgi:hypothetical protein
MTRIDLRFDKWTIALNTKKFSVRRSPKPELERLEARASRHRNEGIRLGFFKSVMGFGGVEQVGDRILGELESARDRGEQQLVVGYTQSEIGIRANATQMAVFIRRKMEKKGFEVLDGKGGEFGEDVRLLVGWTPPKTSLNSDLDTPEAGSNTDLQQFNRAVQAARDAPPVGKEGAGMSNGQIAEIQAWMRNRFDVGDYETIWHRRLALGYALSGDGIETETWFWINAFPALSALRLGEKDHPFVATAPDLLMKRITSFRSEAAPLKRPCRRSMVDSLVVEVEGKQAVQLGIGCRIRY